MMAMASFFLSLLPSESLGQSWRGVQDADGCTWARVKFVNTSDQPSSWAVWNGRAAVDSTVDTAVTDQEQNWDGVVNPGETRYVWIYGVLAGDVNIANTDGGPSALYPGANTPVDGADGELAVTIATDGTVTTSIEAGASYEIPTHTGNFDPNS